MQYNQNEEKKKLKNLQALVKSGDKFCENGKYDEAIICYTKALNLYPKYKELLNKRGVCYYRKGNFQAAIADCSEIIKLDPTHITSYLYRGISYKKLGNFRAAIADYNMVLQINPIFAAGYYDRASCNRDMNNFEAAVKDYEKAKMFYTDLEDKAICEREINRILSLGPVTLSLSFSSAILKQSSEDSKFDTAENEFDIAIALTCERQGKALFKRNIPEQARLAIEIALEKYEKYNYAADINKCKEMLRNMQNPYL